MSKALSALFTPCQTLASFTHHSELYREYRPCGPLREDIMCYWASPAEPGVFLADRYQLRDDTIVPDGCVDFIFRIHKTTGDCHSYVVGPADQPLHIVQNFITYQTFGVRFNPGGCYPYIRVPLAELANKHYPLNDVAGQVADSLAPRLAAAASVAEMIELADRFFVRFRRNCRPRSDSVSNFLYYIYSAAGNITVSELAERERLSARQMQRLFGTWLGVGPKAFCKVVRFQRALSGIDGGDTSDWADIAFGAGYFDQAHFINEFKAFCGEPPGKAFSRQTLCPIFPSKKTWDEVE